VPIQHVEGPEATTDVAGQPTDRALVLVVCGNGVEEVQQRVAVLPGGLQGAEEAA
jgi:hypothetical protein